MLTNPISKPVTTTPKPVAVKPKPAIKPPEFDQFSLYFCHPFDPILDKGNGWITLKHPLDAGQIWQIHQDGDRLIGLGFGKFTRYALLDIDKDSTYHSEEGLRYIRGVLETIGINDTVLIQSSWSEGWHLYFAFSEPIHTFSLSCLLHQALTESGLEIAKGTLEIFPNRKGWHKDSFTTYNRHRLPLQPNSGSHLLDEDLNFYSENIGTFLNWLDGTAIANDTELIKELASLAKADYNPSQGKSDFTFSQHHGSAKQWKRDLEEAIASGWTGKKQTHDQLGRIAEYGRVFLGIDSEAELTDFIVATAISSPGFAQFSNHAEDLPDWAARWAKSAMRYRYPYGSRKGQFKKLGKGGLTNEERKADAMERVANTVNDYQESGREWPATKHARRKLIAGLAHCSERTLMKKDYLPLWHPDYMAIADQDADDIQDSGNAYGEQDTATQNNAGSHPYINVKSSFPSLFFPHHHPVLPLAAGRDTNLPQTLIQQGIQPMEEKLPAEIVLKPGDWVTELDRRELLRLQSFDGDGWVRCQDARQRRLGLRGSPYHLSQLRRSPLMPVENEEEPW